MSLFDDQAQAVSGLLRTDIKPKTSALSEVHAGPNGEAVYKIRSRDSEPSFQIFSMKHGKKHGLEAIAKGLTQKEPHYFMFYQYGKLVAQARTLELLKQRIPRQRAAAVHNPNVRYNAYAGKGY